MYFFTKEFWSKWWLHIGFIVLAIALFVSAVVMSIPAEIKNDVFQYFFHDKEGKKVTISFMISLAELLFVIVIVKILLAQRAFLEAIYEHFKTIFVEKSIVKLYNDEELRKIARDISSTNKGIVFDDQEFRNKSILLLEKRWKEGNHEDSTIITESKYITTIYGSGHEIIHKKIYFKMMKDGNFSFSYYFIPPDKTTDYSLYEDDNHSRWDGRSFKILAKRTRTSNESIEIKHTFSIDSRDKDWIHLEVSLNTERQAALREGNEFMIEFSITSPIDLGNSTTARERRNEYFEATFIKPHATRSVTFQAETYTGEDMPNFNPKISINSTIKDPDNEISGIYYKKWNWEFFYSENIDNRIKLTVED